MLRSRHPIHVGFLFLATGCVSVPSGPLQDSSTDAQIESSLDSGRDECGCDRDTQYCFNTQCFAHGSSCSPCAIDSDCSNGVCRRQRCLPAQIGGLPATPGYPRLSSPSAPECEEWGGDRTAAYYFCPRVGCQMLMSLASESTLIACSGSDAQMSCRAKLERTDIPGRHAFCVRNEGGLLQEYSTGEDPGFCTFLCSTHSDCLSENCQPLGITGNSVCFPGPR